MWSLHSTDIVYLNITVLFVFSDSPRSSPYFNFFQATELIIAGKYENSLVSPPPPVSYQGPVDLLPTLTRRKPNSWRSLGGKISCSSIDVKCLEANDLFSGWHFPTKQEQ